MPLELFLEDARRSLCYDWHTFLAFNDFKDRCANCPAGEWDVFTALRWAVDHKELFV